MNLTTEIRLVGIIFFILLSLFVGSLFGISSGLGIFILCMLWMWDKERKDS